jgi:transcriptional regulator with XRE-family HTH domain
MENVQKRRKKKCIDDSDKRIADTIKRHRCFNNLTQEYIEAVTGISQSRYSRIEKAQTQVTYSELNRLARVMETTTIELAFMAEIETSLDAEQIMLMEIFGKLIKVIGNRGGKDCISADDIQFFLSHVQVAVHAIATQRSE